MSDRKMYFGNRYYMQWIACPESGSDRGARGWESGGQYLHGGYFKRQTFNMARTRTLSWALNGRDVIRPVTDYAEGVYGEGPIYWLDPFDMDQNMLAQSFATPSLGARDGIILAGDERPTLVATASNSRGYPRESAVYSLSSGDRAFRHWIPIPPGYRAVVGAHGISGGGAQVRIIGTKGMTTSGSAKTLSILPVDTDTRFNNNITASPDIDGMEVYLAGSGTVTLSGIMVQVLPIGAPASTGGFISGQGHAGMSFDGYPSKNAYSAALDLVGLTANFVETEQWK